MKYHVELRKLLGTEFDDCFEKLDDEPISKKNKPEVPGIPIYEIDVSAGDLLLFNDGIHIPVGSISVPDIAADFVVSVSGDSMYPEIKGGDRIAVKKMNDFSVINFGLKYLVITKEQRMVKYVKRHDKKDYVLLVSANEFYDPIDLPIKKIESLFQVVAILKKEVI